MKTLKVIFIALAVSVFSAPVLAGQAGQAAVVAQAGGDNRPATLGDLDRLDDRMDRLESGMDRLEGRMDQLDNRMERLEGGMDRLDEKIDNARRDLGARIDTLTTAVWSLLGVIIAGLLGFVAVLIRREKLPALGGVSLSSGPSAPAAPAETRG